VRRVKDPGRGRVKQLVRDGHQEQVGMGDQQPSQAEKYAGPGLPDDPLSLLSPGGHSVVQLVHRPVRPQTEIENFGRDILCAGGDL
jgi:hypothetical protein